MSERAPRWMRRWRRLYDWHRWFAWYPVCVDGERCAWGRTIWRRNWSVFWCLPGRWVYAFEKPAGPAMPWWRREGESDDHHEPGLLARARTALRP